MKKGKKREGKREGNREGDRRDEERREEEENEREKKRERIISRNECTRNLVRTIALKCTYPIDEKISNCSQK